MLTVSVVARPATGRPFGEVDVLRDAEPVEAEECARFRAFVPFWLRSRQEVGPGAKLTDAAMAQQANSRGAVQPHFRVQAAALGEDEGQLPRHLMELEEVGLIQVSRGNVGREDIRVFFPLHPWMAGIEQSPQAVAPQPAAAEPAAPPRLFPKVRPPRTPPFSRRARSPVRKFDSPADAGGGVGRGAGIRSRSTRSRFACDSSRTRRRSWDTTTSGT